jgi:hypothetical protein
VDRTFDHRGHQHVEVGLRRRDPRGEQRAQAVGVGLTRQQVDERVEVADRQRTHQVHAAGRGPETGQGLELP